MTTFPRNILASMVLSLVTAYVALLPQFYLMYEKGNRYTTGWSPRSRAGILLAIGLLGACYALGYWMLRAGAVVLSRRQDRVDCGRLVYDFSLWVMLAVLFRTIMAISFLTGELPEWAIRAIDSPINKTLWYFMLPAIGWLIHRGAMERGILAIYRLMVIIFALFLLQAFRWDIYTNDSSGQAISARGTQQNNQGSLYIFLFDEWSYEHSFGHPEFSLTQMPRLTEFLGQSTLFHRAYSPAAGSGVSIPRFLYQPDERIQSYSYADVQRLLLDNGFMALNLKSIFDLSDRHFKFVAGTYLHYYVILGSKVDRILRFDDNNIRYSLLERVMDLLFTQVDFLGKFGVPIPAHGQSPLSASGWQSLAMEFQSRIRPVISDVLPALPDQSIAFFHLYLPHPPYLFMRDWTRRNPLTFSDPGTIGLYQENVYAIDAVIGDIMGHLKNRGDFDSSMIVITSDHSWKYHYSASWEELDPEPYLPEKHVPLIIKYPGQVRGGSVDMPIRTVELHPQFDSFLNVPDRMRQWVVRWNAGETTNAWFMPD